MSRILVTNIQRFSLHDGPGIRTTIFLKGCSLRCPWCSNPENLADVPQKYVKDGVEGVYGKWYTSIELLNEVMKDKVFYSGYINEYSINKADLIEKLPGGITFSGGEALLQIKRLEKILNQLRELHIHCVVETSLFVPNNNLVLALKYFDLFYVDMKILNKEKCKEYLCGDINQYISNLEILDLSGVPFIIRIPVIGGYTDNVENRKEVIDRLKKLKGNLLKIELIKEHNLGMIKYQSLRDGGNDIKIPSCSSISDELMEKYKYEIEEMLNVPVEICAI